MVFNEAKMRSLFELADLTIVGEAYPLYNQYWNLIGADMRKYDDETKYDMSAVAHVEYALKSPWFLVEVEHAGWVKLGWRKRVIDIDWGRTDIRVVVTEDQVTKDETMVHAWDYAKAIEYLSALRVFINSRKKTCPQCNGTGFDGAGSVKDPCMVCRTTGTVHLR